MTRNTLMAGVGALVLIFVGGAFAASDMGKGMHGHGHMDMRHEDPGAMADHLMGHFDVNKDGKITRDEILNATRKETDEHFAAMDANRDGKVTSDELYQAHVAHLREHTDEVFKHLDGNNDGELTQDEFAAAGPKIMMMHHHGFEPGHDRTDDDED